MEVLLKSALMAAAILLPVSIASAQTTQPTGARPLDQVPKAQERLEINQILGLKQIDAATYEISVRLEDGTPIDLRMNAFVMQDLGKRLGTFGRAPSN